MTSSDHTAYENADKVLATKGRSFHWARHLLGEIHANRATRLYGFCRWIDDLADESVSKEAALAALGQASTDIQAGKSAIATMNNMLRLIDECQIDPAIVQELITGVVGDLELVRIETQAELLRYCYRVAGTVGLMMSAVLDVKKASALPHAIDLGIGMQLTNICRDVREDAVNDRRYLPAELIGQLTLAQLAMPDAELKPKVCAGVSALLSIADNYYKSGENGLSYLPVHARSGIMLASRVYRGIGVKLKRQSYDYWTSRTVVSSVQKAKISVIAIGQIPLMRSFWAPTRQHDEILHIPLVGLPKVNLKSLARVKPQDAPNAD